MIDPLFNPTTLLVQIEQASRNLEKAKRSTPDAMAEAMAGAIVALLENQKRLVEVVAKMTAAVSNDDDPG